MKSKNRFMNQMIIINQHQNEWEYWHQNLTGEIGITEFPGDAVMVQAIAEPNKRMTFDFTLPESAAAQLIKLGGNSDYAIHVILFSEVAVLLNKYTGNEDIVMGSPIYRQEGIDGEFINTMLPLRTRVEAGMSFKELLLQVRQIVADAVEHQNFPIDLLFDQLREENQTADTSLYSTVVMLENIHDKRYLDAVAYRMLFHFVREDTGIRGTVHFDPDRYTEPAVKRIISHFTHLLGQALLQVGADIRELGILPEQERSQILLEFNGKRGYFPPDAAVSQLIEEQVQKTPDAVAVQCGEHTLTYRELNEQANRLAWLLKEKGSGPDKLAAVLCERSIPMLVGILGLFKAGGAYVPIDAAYPMERIRTMLSDSGASIVLTVSAVFAGSDEMYRGIVAGTSVEHIVYLDRLKQTEQDEALFRTERAVSLLERGESIVPGPEMALCSGNKTLAYEVYRERTGQLAGFLKNRLGNQRDGAGVLLDDSLDKLVAFSALQRLDLGYTVLDAMNPAGQLQDSGTSFLVTTSRYVDEVDRLLWESESLQGYVLLDEYDAASSEKQLQMRNIWEAVAEETSEALNDYGWSSSYGGKAFSLEEMQEYIGNFQTKLKPHLTKESKVLEVGCGHGLLLFHLAPDVKEYVATDLSGTIIERNRERARREGLSHVKLRQAAASEIGGIGESDFDVIVMSSVVHYFPNTLYLEEVIRSAIGLLKEEGILYLDDLLDHRKKGELAESTAAYKEANPGVPVKTSWDEDLFVDESFFQDLQQKYPEICGWESSRKLGTIDNELTRFRYDVMLRVNKKHAREENRRPSLSVQKGRYTWKNVRYCASCKDLEHLLETRGIEKLGTVVDQSAIAAMPADNPPGVNKPEDLCYVIYTSGSTGRPKGAMVEHRGMLNHLYAKIHDFRITGDSVIAQNASHCFDISVWQFFSALVTGGKVVIYPNELTLDAEAFIDHIQQDGVTILEVVPSYLSVLLEHLEPEQTGLEKLELLVVTGEALKPNLVGRWFGKYPGIRMANAYGPTEASDDITHYLMEQDPGRVMLPVGSPVQNMTIYIVDEAGELCPVGVKGEIWVAGIGVGRGYLNQEEKTREAFTEDPFAKEPGVRLYKTGDIGRWLEDGNIEFLGRKDDQVKIRGYRIEIGEVENRLSEIAGIKEAVVTVRGGEKTGKYLCAYVTGEEKIDTEKVKRELGRSLPDYMVPEYVVEMEKLPLTRNGKVDRKALPVPEKQGEGSVSYEAPISGIEKKLAGMWSEVLGIDRVGVNDNFFYLGGHSLKMMSLSGRIQKEYGIKITMNQLFQYPTIKEFGTFLEDALGHGRFARNLDMRIPPVPSSSYYEVSSAQKRLFLLNRIDNLGLSYNITAAFLLEGDLNKQTVERCFRNLMERHEALRTSFILHDGDIMQRIHEHIPFELNYCQANEKDVNSIIERFTARFELDKAPLLRAGMIELAKDKHILMFDQHHIISDGVSVQLLMEEFIRLYNGETLPNLNIQYKDFAAWQNRMMKSDYFRKQESYWLDIFKKECPTLNLPLDFPRPKYQSYEGNGIDFRISKAINERLNDMARKNGATLYMVLLAAFHVMLSKYTSQEDIVIGSPVAGRQHPDLEQVLGVFINILCIRNESKPELTFREFLQQVKGNTLDAYEHRDYPFEHLVNQLKLNRDLSRNPIFDVLFVLQNMSETKLQMNGLSVTPYEFNNHTTQYDLKLEIFETDDNELECSFSYGTKLFKKETIQLMADRFVWIVNQLMTHSDAKLSEISLSTEEERYDIVHRFNDTDMPLTCGTIHECFEERVRKKPHLVALVHRDQVITYQELNEKANQVARLLAKAGIKTNEPVGLSAGRNANMITAMLGILKAGGCYVPIDPEYPLHRKQHIMRHSGIRMLMVDGVGQSVELLNADSDIEVLISLSQPDNAQGMLLKKPGIIIYNEGDIMQQPTENLSGNSHAGDLMYVMYTSGSTGLPKGVMVTHENVSNFIQWSINHFGLGPDDNMMLVTSICFDISVFEIFGALLSSATLHIVDAKMLHAPRELLNYISQQQIHVWHSVPTLMNQAVLLLNHYGNTRTFHFQHVRLIMLGGESWSVKLAKQIKEHFTQAEIHNMYGPTETTIWVTSYHLEGSIEEMREIPIGKPIANNQVWIKDPNGHLCSVGLPGDIYISGKNVTQGYFHNNEETAKKFVRDKLSGKIHYQTGDIGRYLPDGSIEFLGRSDHLVKVRGYRVETGEIERALLQKQGIDQVVVVARREQETTNLVCYYVGSMELDGKDLSLHLENLLPHYMIPSRFIRLENLPLTPNGKIDQKALRNLAEQEDAVVVHDEPANELEERIASVWRDVLGVEKVDVNDDFYQHGGNSLLIIKLEVELEKRGLFKSGINLFEHNTIRQLAVRLQTDKNDVREEKHILHLNDEFVAAGETGEMAEHAEQYILTPMEPFNDIFYKNCFYNSAFAVMKHFNRNAVDLIINDLGVYAYEQNFQKLNIEYIQLKAIETILEEQQIGMETKIRSRQIVEDIMHAISIKRPVIIWVDCFYSSLRADKYQKEHYPHTWLVYGYDTALLEFTIIEQAHNDQLSYGKRTVSFEEIASAYNGYVEQFSEQHPDEPTYYEFYLDTGCGDGHEDFHDRSKHYTDFLLDSYVQNKGSVEKSLEQLMLFIDDFEAIALHPEALERKAPEYLESLNDVINGKRVERFKVRSLFGDEWKGDQLISDIIKNWEMVRTVVAKYHFSSIYNQQAVAEAISRLKVIEQLETEYAKELIK
ncbi:amino acid adenylation domain-containing protein [Paenibacillus larvae]|uniref:amino acid adenylation domain-containing protein n=4 Tax=Paenibacillus larvae TaxID=1464 RepID=UPI0033E2FC3C